MIDGGGGTRQKGGNILLGYATIRNFSGYPVINKRCARRDPFLFPHIQHSWHGRLFQVSILLSLSYHFVGVFFPDGKVLLCPVDADWCFVGRIQGGIPSLRHILLVV